MTISGDTTATPKARKHSLYWLHLPEHHEPDKEGYVGVSVRAEYRYKEHIDKLKAGTHENIHLTHAYLRYGERIVFSVLAEGNEEELYNKEHELRPKKDVGWNIAEGGFKPPTKYGDDNNARQPEARQKISKAKLGNKCGLGSRRSDEWRHKHSLLLQGRPKINTIHKGRGSY